jgi:Zn-dependent protease
LLPAIPNHTLFHGKGGNVFGRGITLFRLFGFSVRVDWSWLIIAGLLIWSLASGIFPAYYHNLAPETYWWMGVVGAFGLFLSIILHEMGHSLAAQRFGIPMKGITLFIFGGVAEMGGEPPSPKAEFFTAIAGPLVTVVLIGIFFGFTYWAYSAGWPVAVRGVLAYLAWINIVVLAFNLVPAFPLDGGRVLRSILWWARKNLRWATRIASAIGVAFAFALMVWGLFSIFLIGNLIGGIWAFLIGLFIRNASRASYQQVLLRDVLAGEPVSHFMSANPVTVPPTLTVRELVDNYLYRYPYKFYPIVKDGELVGCVSVDQVKQIPREEWDHRTAETMASPCSRDNMIEPTADASKALSTMTRAQVSRLMVVDHGRLLGIVALRDLLNYLSRKMELEGA